MTASETVVLNLSSIMNPLENLMKDVESISGKCMCIQFQEVYKPHEVHLWMAPQCWNSEHLL